MNYLSYKVEISNYTLIYFTNTILTKKSTWKLLRKGGVFCGLFQISQYVSKKGRGDLFYQMKNL